MRHPVLAHMRDHVWFWIAGLLVLGLALGWAGLATPAAFLVMISGILIIVKSQGTDVLTIVTTNPVAPSDGMNGDNTTVRATPQHEPAYR
ncbi:hypothetical protein JMJ55_04745 [Belnapia sp. T6]|uniref:Uncharacterized protein n=1 Tax=Belnapia mucosa TaxID=2804532 RepID=A0ABS1UYU5_9PROT|nr:hypothetical protein [Belnapia mucosa]MBL6454620.1 hypothetical protein [Belnapia mucosa]